MMHDFLEQAFVLCLERWQESMREQNAFYTYTMNEQLERCTLKHSLDHTLSHLSATLDFASQDHCLRVFLLREFSTRKLK